MEDWILLLLQTALLAGKYVPFFMETEMNIICHCPSHVWPRNSGSLDAGRCCIAPTRPGPAELEGVQLPPQLCLEGEGDFISADSKSLTVKRDRGQLAHLYKRG